MCCIKRTRDADTFLTLGIFKPKVIEQLIIKPTAPNWSKPQLDILRQNNLFESGPTQELEKVPFDFSYRYKCDHEDCKGHTMKCTDWEMGESWRRWSKEYGDKWEEKFRQRYEKEMIEIKDTHFYVGTIHQHPHEWIIVGLFYPMKEKERSMPLFDTVPMNTHRAEKSPWTITNARQEKNGILKARS